MVNVSNLTHYGPTVRTSDGVSGVDPAKSRVGRVGEHIHGVYVWRRSGCGHAAIVCVTQPMGRWSSKVNFVSVVSRTTRKYDSEVLVKIERIVVRHGQRKCASTLFGGTGQYLPAPR